MVVMLVLTDRTGGGQRTLALYRRAAGEDAASRDEDRDVFTRALSANSHNLSHNLTSVSLRGTLLHTCQSSVALPPLAMTKNTAMRLSEVARGEVLAQGAASSSKSRQESTTHGLLSTQDLHLQLGVQLGSSKMANASSAAPFMSYDEILVQARQRHSEKSRQPRTQKLQTPWHRDAS